MLVKQLLKEEILKITDASNPQHEGFPQNIFEAAERWATAINNYASQVLPVSLTADSAKVSLVAHLGTANDIGTQSFINGLIAYSIILSNGMNPAFSGVMPATPLNLQPIFNMGLNGASSEEVAEYLSVEIDRWFRTGTAINNSIGATINWN